MSLLVVGTVAFDSIETPFGKAERIVGGAATYASLAASFLIRPVHIVSVVGSDFPEAQLAAFRAHGIDTSGIEVREGEESFFWSGRYQMDMNSRDTLETRLNVLANFDPRIPDSCQNPDFLLLGNLTPAIQHAVMDRIEKRPRLVVLDTMNFWMTTALNDLKRTFHRIDVLTINEEEARMLSNEYSLVKAAKSILEMGPKYLIIKKGEHGALLFNKHEVFYAPALPLEEVFDPTGAGDTFAGGFIGYLAKSRDISFENMKRALIHGSAMASFCVEQFGIKRLENLTQEDLDARLQLFIDLVQFDIALD
jgi:sugar/nucleoside kinase (ribokinase family)